MTKETLRWRCSATCRVPVGAHRHGNSRAHRESAINGRFERLGMSRPHGKYSAGASEGRALAARTVLDIWDRPGSSRTSDGKQHRKTEHTERT